MRYTLPMIALAMLAAPAVAAPAQDEVVTVRIAYGDVDATTTDGRAAIEARINSELRKACTVEASSRYAFGRPAIDSKCLTDSRTAALAEVERVAALEARSGRTVAAN